MQLLPFSAVDVDDLTTTFQSIVIKPCSVSPSPLVLCIPLWPSSVIGFLMKQPLLVTNVSSHLRQCCLTCQHITICLIRAVPGNHFCGSTLPKGKERICLLNNEQQTHIFESWNQLSLLTSLQLIELWITGYPIFCGMFVFLFVFFCFFVCFFVGCFLGVGYSLY